MVDWFRKEGGGGWELARAAACMDILSDKRCKGAHCSTHVRTEMINTPQRLTLMIKKKRVCFVFPTPPESHFNHFRLSPDLTQTRDYREHSLKSCVLSP